MPLFDVSVSGYDAETHAIELIVTNETGSKCIVRSYDQLEVLGEALPSFPSTRSAAALTQFCAQLDAFLQCRCYCSTCLWLAEEIRQCDSLRELVETDATPNTLSAIEFVLQPFPLQVVNIASGTSHRVQLEASAQSQVVWKFSLDAYDIDFSVQFVTNDSTQVVHAVTRYEDASQGTKCKFDAYKQDDTPVRPAELWSFAGTTGTPSFGRKLCISQHKLCPRQPWMRPSTQQMNLQRYVVTDNSLMSGCG